MARFVIPEGGIQPCALLVISNKAGHLAVVRLHGAAIVLSHPDHADSYRVDGAINRESARLQLLKKLRRGFSAGGAFVSLSFIFESHSSSFIGYRIP